MTTVSALCALQRNETSGFPPSHSGSLIWSLQGKGNVRDVELQAALTRHTDSLLYLSSRPPLNRYVIVHSSRLDLGICANSCVSHPKERTNGPMSPKRFAPVHPFITPTHFDWRSFP